MKICCEGQNLTHFGECNSFPCEKLHAFSYDAEHGDDGARIKQCEEWAKCCIK